MNNTDLPLKSSSAWSMFTYVSFAIAAAMMAGGIYFLEASFSAKGFYAMSALMLVHTTVSITKTMRDDQEASRMINKLEEARTEKLIMEMNRNG
ncbi:YiaA/YiaB family inner membrane protein [Aestuariivirga sp.]|uniref:YiaA/YiaB family inner membrane protein n=1 Tax=Aestuariivirga sp. TaxID=2650926 RepID=UPI0039E34AD5